VIPFANEKWFGLDNADLRGQERNKAVGREGGALNAPLPSTELLSRYQYTEL
jgi:hypothetical protein